MPVELIVGAVVGAAAASPKARSVIRKGIVYGLAGGLIAYDRLARFRGPFRSAPENTGSEEPGAKPQVQESQPEPATTVAPS
jgi:hypothetical protein